MKFVLDGYTLLEAMACLRNYTSKEVTRHYLNGVYFHCEKDGYISLAATDGHKLCAMRMPTQDGTEDFKKLKHLKHIMHRDNIFHLVNFMKMADRPSLPILPIIFEWDATKNSMLIHIAGTSFTSRGIDGTFPDYKRVYPQGDKPAFVLGMMGKNVLDAVKGMVGDNAGAFEWKFYDPSSPVLLTRTSTRTKIETDIIIMPCRL